jgi:hypothetical protein
MTYVVGFSVTLTMGFTAAEEMGRLSTAAMSIGCGAARGARRAENAKSGARSALHIASVAVTPAKKNARAHRIANVQSHRRRLSDVVLMESTPFLRKPACAGHGIKIG